MESNKWEGKRSINEAEEEDENDEEDNKRKRLLTLSGRKQVSGGAAAQLCCQVEQCTTDMSDAKPYHRRHKVCEFHSKATLVLINGIPQRFCQQCSRFHQLAEFDEAKRSCRRRLAGHNERRRKTVFDSLGETSS